MLAAARLLWEERVGAGVVRVADRLTQLSERCVARAAGRGACYISRLEAGWGAPPLRQLSSRFPRCSVATLRRLSDSSLCGSSVSAVSSARRRDGRRLLLVSLQTLARIANFRLRSAERCV